MLPEGCHPPEVALPIKKDTMKVHTTNYQNTFIAIAEDCPVAQGEMWTPPLASGPG